MTNTKKQLMTAIAMLVVAALALGTSTYAWFKANTDVKVESLSFTAQSVEDVQIALISNAWDGSLNGGANPTAAAFKTIISAQDVATLYASLDSGSKTANLTTGALQPASTASLPTFYKVADGDEAWDLVGGDYKAKKFAPVTTVVGNDCVKAIPLYIKSTSATSIYFDTNNMSVLGDATPAVRIGFKAQGGTDIIWAPNSTGHIDNHRLTTVGDADGITTAVNSPAGTGSIDTGVYKTALDPDTPIFSLAAGEAKLLIVYIWLEGCDEDCVSGISAEDLTVNLAFTSNHA